jgi:hypothetical protein
MWEAITAELREDPHWRVHFVAVRAVVADLIYKGLTTLTT